MRKVIGLVLGILMVVTLFASFGLAANFTISSKSSSRAFEAQYLGSGLCLRASVEACKSDNSQTGYYQTRVLANDGSPCAGPSVTLTTNWSITYSGWAAYQATKTMSAKGYSRARTYNPWDFNTVWYY